MTTYVLPDWSTNYYLKPGAYDLLRADGFLLTRDMPFHMSNDPQRLQTLDSAGSEPEYREMSRDEFLRRYTIGHQVALHGAALRPGRVVARAIVSPAADSP